MPVPETPSTTVLFPVTGADAVAVTVTTVVLASDPTFVLTERTTAGVTETEVVPVETQLLAFVTVTPYTCVLPSVGTAVVLKLLTLTIPLPDQL